MKIVQFFLFLLGYHYTSSQSIQELQDALDTFCHNVNNPGCGGNAQGTPSTGPGQGVTFQEGNCRKCPGNEKCVPADFNCSIMSRGVRCNIPRDYGIAFQTLACGDKPQGPVCHTRGTVSVLTIILVQCDGPKPLSKLGVHEFPSGAGGAGIYQCNAQGDWTPLKGSPTLFALVESCRNSGCGDVPQPRKNLMPVHRNWGAVRAIHKDGRIHCTATLVTQYAAVTAAHCLTGSSIDRNADLRNVHLYTIELPIDSFSQKRQTRTAQRIYVHPNYDITNGQHFNDIGIIFFGQDRAFRLPTVCIADLQYTNQRRNTEVVFSLQAQRNDFFWRTSKAASDSACQNTIGLRVGLPGGCVDVKPVHVDQFCLKHSDMTMTTGSSGGPHLIEVGNAIKEVWVLMGVLSAFSNDSSCALDHSIFGDVGANNNWLRDCVYKEKHETCLGIQ